MAVTDIFQRLTWIEELYHIQPLHININIHSFFLSIQTQLAVHVLLTDAALWYYPAKSFSSSKPR